MDPEVEEYLTTHPQTNSPLPTDIHTFRSISHALETTAIAHLGPPPPSIKESPLPIPMRDTHLNTAQLFQRKPSTTSSPGPLIVLFHGGGFAVGSPIQFTLLARSLVSLLPCTVISAAYRLAPETPFPTPAQDAWDTLSHLASHPPPGVDLARGFIIGGASSGANLAAVVAQLAQTHNLSPPLTGQFLSLPLIFPSEESVPESYREMYTSISLNDKDPIQSLPSLHAILRRYAPNPRSPLFSPVNSLSFDPAKLPKTYIQVCGLDPLRDDGIIYEKLLREEGGVATRLDVYEKFPHGWWLFMPGLRSSGEAVGDMVRGVGWLLGVEVDAGRVRGYLEGKAGLGSV